MAKPKVARKKVSILEPTKRSKEQAELRKKKKENGMKLARITYLGKSIYFKTHELSVAEAIEETANKVKNDLKAKKKKMKLQKPTHEELIAALKKS